MGGGVPKCSYVPELGMFRVMSIKGKSFSSYGVIFPDESRRHQRSDETTKSVSDIHTSGNDTEEMNSLEKQVREQSSKLACNKNDISATDQRNNAATIPKAAKHQSPKPPIIYLFIEEALFLHERGLLEVYDKDESTTLDSQYLFGMLPSLGVSFPIYVTYAHLRVQTYIVMRHVVERLDIVDELLAESKRKMRTRNNNATSDTELARKEGENVDEDHAPEHDQGSGKKSDLDLTPLKRRLRMAEAHAPAPTLLRSSHTFDKWGKYSAIKQGEQDTEERKTPRSSISSPKCPIAYDVYLPDASFRRTNPGRPDFCVAVAPYAEASPGFSAMHALISIAKGVPVRVATVADGGTVVMFSLTDYGVPPINQY